MTKNEYADLVFEAFELIADLAAESGGEYSALTAYARRAEEIHLNMNSIAVLHTIEQASQNDYRPILKCWPIPGFTPEPPTSA